MASNVSQEINAPDGLTQTELSNTTQQYDVARMDKVEREISTFHSTVNRDMHEAYSILERELVKLIGGEDFQEYRNLIVNRSREAMNRNLHNEKLRIRESVDIALYCIREGVPKLVCSQCCGSCDERNEGGDTLVGKQLYKL